MDDKSIQLLDAGILVDSEECLNVLVSNANVLGNVVIAGR